MCSPRLAVAFAVRAFGERGAAGRAERSGWIADAGRARSAVRGRGAPSSSCISARNPVVIVVSALPSPSAVAASNRFCTAGKIDDGIVASRPRSNVGAHDDVHRRVRNPAGRAVIHLGEHLGCEARLRERAAAAPPTPAGRDRRSRRASRRRARRRTPTAACSPRSARTSPRSTVARRCRRRPPSVENARHARWRATTPKRSSSIRRSRSPTRTNELTYMMRRLGPHAQRLNASVLFVADALHHERRHRFERGFGIVGVHLVEVHEAWIAAGSRSRTA